MVSAPSLLAPRVSVSSKTDCSGKCGDASPPAAGTESTQTASSPTTAAPAASAAVTAGRSTTVSLSAAARAAYLESIETPAQTAIEARNNDPQAQRLLVKLALTKG